MKKLLFCLFLFSGLVSAYSGDVETMQNDGLHETLGFCAPR